MGREADISKKRVIDTAKLGIEKTNTALREVADMREAHNAFVRIVEGKINEAKDIAHRASVWSEANETMLANAKKRLEDRINTLIQTLESLDKGVQLLLRTAPPTGFFPRLWWLLSADGIQRAPLTEAQKSDPVWARE